MRDNKLVIILIAKQFSYAMGYRYNIVEIEEV